MSASVQTASSISDLIGKPMAIDTQKSTLDYAFEYIRIGWWVLPLAEKSKQPAGWLVPNGVHGASNDPEVITRWFTSNPNCGIGIAMKPSGLVAVDIDPRNGGMYTLERLEAQYGKIESDVYAFTGGGGGHLVFTSQLVTNLPGTLGPGIDLKADGYIVAEPSIHPNGKQYGWEASSNPLEGCVPSALPNWIRDLARVAPVTASDKFVSQYVTPQQHLELKEALSFIDCEDYHQWIKIGQALKGAGAAGFGLWDNWSKTSEKYDPSEMGKKWRSFAPTKLNIETVFFDAQVGGWVNPMGKAAAEREAKLKALADEAQRVKVYESVKNPVVELKPFPVKMLDEVCTWICKTQGVKNCVSVQMSAISIASIAASRLYASEYGDGANLYQLLSAPSVGDLLPLHHSVIQIMTDSGLRKMTREQRFTSTSTLYQTLMRSPASLWLSSEWGTLTSFSKRQSSGLVLQMMGKIVSTYSAKSINLDNVAELGFQKSSGFTDDMPSILKPALNILALNSNDMLSSSFTVEEIGRGCIAQFMFNQGNVELNGSMKEEVTPEWLVTHLRVIRNLPACGNELDLASIFNGNAELLPTQKIVRFESKPEEHYKLFDDISSKNSNSKIIGYGARTNLRRLSVALAVWDNPDQPVVTRSIMDWCASFVADRLRESLSALNLIGGSDDGKASLYQLVLQAISNTGGEGCTVSNIRYAVYKFRSLATVKRDELITQLIEDGEIVERKNSNGKGCRLFASSEVVGVSK